MRLIGKNAVITGSGAGIGRAIAIRFAREGADVVLNDLPGCVGLRDTRDAVEALGRRSATVEGDIGQLVTVQRVIDVGVKQMGRLDLLVSNAGIDREAPFLEMSEADFDAVLRVNLKGGCFLAQAFARHLVRSRRPGKIIFISSVHEELPLPKSGAYCASKGGLRMLTRDLAAELGKHGITVNAIAPGAIDTPGNTALLGDPPRLAALLRQIPLGRLGTPDDVAGLAAFLACADADYVTGSTYFIDGGLTWHYEE